MEHLFARAVDFSPDGNTIALADKSSPEGPSHIDLVTVATGARRQFTTPAGKTAGDTSPVFSPDGRTLAFKRSSGSGSDDLYLAEIAGGKLRQLIAWNGHVSALDWTPDGKAIVFSAAREGVTGLWRMRAAGGTPQRIVGAGSGALFFSIARHRHRLAYSYWFADTNVWRMSAKDGGQAGMPEKLIASTRAETSAQYSPDGSMIAFRSDESGATEIWLTDSFGNNVRQLTAFRGPLTGSPRWSPDSRNLAFDSRPGGKSNIYVIASAGGQPRRVTAGPADNVVPSWSQDGKWIYFASTASGAWQVWKVTADGSGKTVQLSHTGGFAAFESPDGSYVYYAKGSSSPGLWRVPSSGGMEELVLPDLKPGYWGCWGVAEDGIYFVDPVANGKFEVRLFDPVTRKTATAAALPGEPPFGDSGFSVSRDGRWFLFTQTDQSGSDIVLVNNFR